MEMKRIGPLIGGILVMSATPTHAGVYADDLTKCIVNKSSVSDQTILIQWIFSAMSSAPAVKSMITTTDAQHVQYNRQGADLFSRLILTDCRAEALAVMKYEGVASFEQSFQILGEVAMRGLMTDPAVQKQMQQFGSYFDDSKFKELGKEAGLPDAKPQQPSPQK
jgi:hypothetical protein